MKKKIRKYLFENELDPYIIKMLQLDTRCHRGIRTNAFVNKKKSVMMYMEMRLSSTNDYVGIIGNAFSQDKQIYNGFVKSESTTTYDIQEAYKKMKKEMISAYRKYCKK